MSKTKNETEIEAVLKRHLRNREEFRWIGEPAHNNWKPNILGILGRAFSLFFSMIEAVIQHVAFFTCLFLVKSTRWISPILIMIVLVAALVSLAISFNLAKFFYFLHLFLGIGLAINTMGQAIFGDKVEIPLSAVRLSLPTMGSLVIGQARYYVITNQRVFVSEQSHFRDYSLILMADAIVGKPDDGASDILIYDKTNPTGHLPEPIFQLNDIVEEDAQNAYEILRQAREEALEDRALEMGVE